VYACGASTLLPVPYQCRTRDVDPILCLLDSDFRQWKPSESQHNAPTEYKAAPSRVRSTRSRWTLRKTRVLRGCSSMHSSVGAEWHARMATNGIVPESPGRVRSPSRLTFALPNVHDLVEPALFHAGFLDPFQCAPVFVTAACRPERIDGNRMERIPAVVARSQQTCRRAVLARYRASISIGCHRATRRIDETHFQRTERAGECMVVASVPRKLLATPACSHVGPPQIAYTSHPDAHVLDEVWNSFHHSPFFSASE